jgi:hypothetical protein
MLKNYYGDYNGHRKKTGVASNNKALLHPEVVVWEQECM